METITITHMEFGPQKQTKAYTARRLREDLNQAIGELMINKVVCHIHDPLSNYFASWNLWHFKPLLQFKMPGGDVNRNNSSP